VVTAHGPSHQRSQALAAIFHACFVEERVCTKWFWKHVREVSENWWYSGIIPVKYGKWGDRNPFRFFRVTRLQKMVYVDQIPEQSTEHR
jgi:hypothetical protein